MKATVSPYKIERVSVLSKSAIAGIDFSFTVTEEAVQPFDGQSLHVVPVSAYDKAYPRDDELFVKTSTTERMIATISVREDLVGYVAVSRAWNGCALIDDIQLSRQHRGLGLGRRLMDEAVRWANECDLPIVRLETQSNNVPACRFYEKYGFKLGGYDRYLYDGLAGHAPSEVALFWYLHLT